MDLPAVSNPGRRSVVPHVKGILAARTETDPEPDTGDPGAADFEQRLHADESIILFALVGVGRTHVAQDLGHLAIRQSANARYATTSRILAGLAGGHAHRAWDGRMREIVRPDLLILDDFALQQTTAPLADDPCELISERQGRSVIISERAHSDRYPLTPIPQPRRCQVPSGPADQRRPTGDHERPRPPSQ
ncbi:ATP-binding protein [Streptomyces sp. NRRL F-4474]|uniref:ATP-binding protein n=1 Tax=Streptomyces sp. NRRL F-4474 TaxID=1463851 RepID=UPI001F229825|nr:ATP-binding protein [Streptomyces sp. NRRL F-4474]